MLRIKLKLSHESVNLMRLEETIYSFSIPFVILAASNQIWKNNNKERASTFNKES